MVIGRAHDVQRVAVVVFWNFQDNEIEPHFLRVEYFRIECGENVPHVGVVNHGVLACNEFSEIFVRIDGVAHCGIDPFTRFLVLAPCARHHFLHVFALAVRGSRCQHFFVLAGRGFECIHQRAILIRQKRVQRDSIQNDAFHFGYAFGVSILPEGCHACNERLQFTQP